MSNNSGIQQTIINTLERAVSTDIGALQHGSAKSLALQTMYNVNTSNTYGVSSYGHTVLSTVNGTPLSADVFGGLQVRVASTYLLISAGVVGVRGTTSDYDSAVDADYVIVNSAGVTSSTALLFALNGSASQRVDIVECSIADSVSALQSRDIYNPTTGLFTASLVPKTESVALNFRIRNGTAGAGFPGVAPAWLPLCVIVHRANSTSFAMADFYDVRPLVLNRRSQGGRMIGSYAWFSPNYHSYGIDSGSNLITGAFSLDANTFEVPGGAGVGGAWNAVGGIHPTAPVTGQDAETEGIDLTAGSNVYYVPGLSQALSDRWLYLISFEPFNLPRWAKYTTAANPTTGEREPGDNWGLYGVCDSTASGISDSGFVSSILPDTYGLGAVQSVAQIVATYHQNVSDSAAAIQTRSDKFVQPANTSPLVTVTGTNDSGTSPNLTTYTIPGQFTVNGRPRYSSGFRVSIEFQVAPNIQVEQCNLSVLLKDGATVIAPMFKKSFGYLGASFTVTLNAIMDFAVSPLRVGALTLEATVSMVGSGAVSFSLFASTATIEGFWIGN